MKIILMIQAKFHSSKPQSNEPIFRLLVRYHADCLSRVSHVTGSALVHSHDDYAAGGEKNDTTYFTIEPAPLGIEPNLQHINQSRHGRWLRYLLQPRWLWPSLSYENFKFDS